MAKVLLSRVLQIAAESNPRITQIAREFKLYKTTGQLGTYIGKDVDIARPLSAKQNELMHIHLFPKRLIVRGIPLRQDKRTSDIFLIYCEGLVDTNIFCLVDIIWNEAHQKLRDEKYVRDNLVSVAERFREAY